jgi:TRAP-type mannitol/chloroaromatic compound transport system substrate-binding protein
VRTLKGWRQAGEQTHHLVEQRLWRANKELQRIWKHVDDMPGFNVTRANHQPFTNAWRDALPRLGQRGHIPNPTIQQILEAAEKVYVNHPELLKQIYLALL